MCQPSAVTAPNALLIVLQLSSSSLPAKMLVKSNGWQTHGCIAKRNRMKTLANAKLYISFRSWSPLDDLGTRVILSEWHMAHHANTCSAHRSVQETAVRCQWVHQMSPPDSIPYWHLAAQQCFPLRGLMLLGDRLSIVPLPRGWCHGRALGLRQRRSRRGRLRGAAEIHGMPTFLQHLVVVLQVGPQGASAGSAGGHVAAAAGRMRRWSCSRLNGGLWFLLGAELDACAERWQRRLV